MASLKSNVTGSALLHTCDPWGLTVSGGKKPYQIVLSAFNSTVITNVTMGDDDDVFTYIDRADPNGSIMGAQFAYLFVVLVFTYTRTIASVVDA